MVKELELGEGRKQVFTHLVLDYTGTLAVDGVLLPGVASRLTALAGQLRILVLTADTCGTALKQLAGLPLEVRLIANGNEKADVVRGIGAETVVAIGNGRNDVPMLEAAGLAIAVAGAEGAYGGLLGVADVVVGDVNDALDLLSKPLRLKATLRD